MKKLLSVLIVGMFPFLVFSAPMLEIVPSPVDGQVGVGKVVVRGSYSSVGEPLRIVVANGSESRFYSPVVLQTEVSGYYQHGVELFKNSNSIMLEKKVGGSWTEIEEISVNYALNDISKETLWGRIANEGIHNKSEQRATYFYQGPRFGPQTAGNENLLFDSRHKLFLSRMNEIRSNYFTRNDSGDYPTKDGLDTKGPADLSQGCWSSREKIGQMMDELKAANVNILIFVHWGAYDETLEENKPYNWSALPAGKESLTDNFTKIYSAATFPETCAYKLTFDNSFCIEKELGSKFSEVNLDDTDSARPDVPELKKTIVSCECAEDEDCLNTTQYCYYGICLQSNCDSDSDCSEGECCLDTDLCGEFFNKCIKKPDIAWYPYFETKNCIDMYDTTDSIEQLFKAAEEKDMLVVPTLEPSVTYMSDFQYNIDPLKNIVKTLLEKYGNHPNWLEIYDAEGNARKAIHISQAIALPAGQYTTDQEETYTVSHDDYRNALDSLSEYFSLPENGGYNIGFLLDVTAMPPDRFMHGWFFPDADYLSEMETLLGVSIFGLPFNQQVLRDEKELSWVWSEDLEPIEDHFVRKGKEWLEKWKDSGLPIIPDVIPGFDDRWRRAFNIFGDNKIWRQRFADLVFMYNTAGINLTIWNGFGEGYVWVPYRMRKFEEYVDANGDPKYSIDPDYQEGNIHGNPVIPNEFLKLKLSENNAGNPIYENKIVYDNYHYAHYLFSADRDNDGVLDINDNCPDVSNPAVRHNPWSEFVSGDHGSFTGAAAMEKGRFQFESIGGWLPVFGYYMQPDHNLDGVGDACDYTSMGGDGFAYSKITNVKPAGENSYTGVPIIPRKMNGYTKINISMPESSGRELNFCNDIETPNIHFGSTCNAAVHYCAITYEENEQDLWGTRGYCSTSDKEGGSYYEDRNIHFGYSHGSDDFSQESIESWQNRISVIESSKDTTPDNWGNSTKEAVEVSNSISDFRIGKESAIWNWRKDWWDERDCSTNPGQPVCQSLESAGEYDEENTMYYTLSTSVLPVDIDTAVEDYPEYTINSNGDVVINPDYFPDTHPNKFTRSYRYSKAPMELNYHQEGEIQGPAPPINLPVIEMEYCAHCHPDVPLDWILKDDLSPVEWLHNVVGRWFIGKDFEGNYIMDAQRLVFPENMLLFNDLGIHEMIAVTENLTSQNETTYEIMMNTSDSGADWHRIGELANWSEEISDIKTITSSSKGIFFLAETDATSHNVLVLYQISRNSMPEEPLNPEDISQITYTLSELGQTEIAVSSSEGIRMISDGYNVYLAESIPNEDVVNMYKLDENNVFTKISGSEAPPARKILNLTVENGYIFLTGGTKYRDDTKMTDFWRFDLANGEWELINDSLEGDFRKVITQPVDGRLVMSSPLMYRGKATHDTFEIDPSIENVADINIDYVDIPVTAVEIAEYESYCLNETDNILKGGLEAGGGCVPFSNPWYRTFSAGAAVNNLSGRGDRVYAALDNAIEIYDISDPEEMAFVGSFSTGSRTVHDLEMGENDILYVATSGGIYKLDASAPDMLSEISFFSTPYNYQYRIKLYDGKLYVGDDNGITIRDTDDFTRLAWENTGPVLTFSIADGEIALYRHSFWGDDTIQVRDTETLYLKAWEYVYCYAVVLSAYQDSFYLSCDNDEYRFEGRPDTYINFYPLEGDSRELRDNHVYDGWTYIPDGSEIKQSTLNSVPSICGNGVTEPGELCDSNSVSCSELNPDYISGTAYCNSTCDGYDESNCSTDDGW